MPKRLKVNQGDRFSRLTIVKEVEPIYWKKYKKRMFLCKCDCGNETIVRLEYLRSGHTKSCGCLRTDEIVSLNKTHGQCNTKLYRLWSSMLRRCQTKSDSNYPNYGARGIEVCNEWQDFEFFYDWSMANGYKKGLSIERIDVNGNYEPSNCEWIPRPLQARNKRNTTFITHKGVTKPLVEWAEELNMNTETLRSRISYGWTIEKALTTPVRNRGW